MQSNKFDFISLPDEVITAIYREMDGIDVVRARQTCSRMHEISTERSIWAGLLAKEDYHLRLDEPLGSYSTQELQKHALRQISTGLAWNSVEKPIERWASDDMEIGDGGKILLEGGRWLLTFGGDLYDSREDFRGTSVFVYDLDCESMGVHELIRFDLRDSHRLRDVLSQAEPVEEITFNIAFIVESDSGVQIQVFQMKQQGRGLDATPIISASFQPIFLNEIILDVPRIQGDFIAVTLEDRIEVINWRTATASMYEKVVLHHDFEINELKYIRLLPRNKLLCIKLNGLVVIYEHANLRQSSYNLIDEPQESKELRSYWEMNINSISQRTRREINLSKPYIFGSTTRLTLRIGERIYGIIVPHDDPAPTLFLLATSQDLLGVGQTTVTLGLTKLYIEDLIHDNDCDAFTLAFPWPGFEHDAAKWKPPLLSCSDRRFEVYESEMGRGPTVLDDASGRVVTGSKYEGRTNGMHTPWNEQWQDIIPWTVIDFCAPQYLPDTY